MRIRERRDHILATVRTKQTVLVDELAEELGASRETIRRDLTDLAIKGLVRKFHGGATLPEGSPAEGVSEGLFQTRLKEQVAEKRAVARVAAQLFQPGDTLFIDTGSTTVIFADELARQSGLTIITNSVMIAQAIARGDGGSRAFLLGGEFNEEVSETLGSLVIEQLKHFHPRHVVLTIGALTTEGILDFSMEETEVARAMVERASVLTVITDASKLGKPGLFQVCPLAMIDRLVIDRTPTGAIAVALEEAGVEVIVAATAATASATRRPARAKRKVA